MANPPASGRDHKEVITYYVDNAQMQEFIARIRTHATKDPVIKLELFFCEYTHDKTAGVRHARTVSNVGKSDSEPNHGRLTTQLFDTTNTDHSAEYELAKPEEAPTWGNFINSTFYKD
jgi:hypothetical protein